MTHIPLREVLITSNVSTFAVLTALTGLSVTVEISFSIRSQAGVALKYKPATRGTTTWASHFFKAVELLSIKQ